MLILKGNSMKNDIINSIIENRRCICFEYYDRPVCSGSWFVDSSKCSLTDFAHEIVTMLENCSYDEFYDYLVVYTNEHESDLAYTLRLLNSDNTRHNYKQLLVTCKD